MKGVFATRLTELRVERGLNQKQLADGIGMTQAAVSRWENGLQLPDIDSLFKLCRFLDTSADYLIGLTDEWGNFYPETQLDYSKFPSEFGTGRVAKIAADTSGKPNLSPYLFPKTKEPSDGDDNE